MERNLELNIVRWRGGGEGPYASLASRDIWQRAPTTFAHPARPGLKAMTIEDLHGTA